LAKKVLNETPMRTLKCSAKLKDFHTKEHD